MRVHIISSGIAAGFALAVMLGQGAAPSRTVEQRLTDIERRLGELELRARPVGAAPVVPRPVLSGVLSEGDLRIYMGSSEAKVLADDGEFLGDLSGAFGTKSVGNEVGTYGNEVSMKSMWNEFGRYGGEVAAQSPFNEVSSRPPRLLYKGEFVCFVTVTTVKTPRIHPAVLRAAVRGD